MHQEDTMTSTPRDIDTRLAAIYGERAEAEAEIQAANAQLSRQGAFQFQPDFRARQHARIEKAEKAIEALKGQAAPLEAIYRGKPWTRFFLVPGGHLHRSLTCSSFQPTTRAAWLPEYSGHSEAEIVDMAGERCCTICYPSAPVHKPSQLPVHVAERQAKAEEAAEKKAAQAAAAAQSITVGSTTFKTQRAAENEISRHLDNMVSARYMTARDESHRQHLTHLALGYEAEARDLAAAIAAQVPGYDPEAVLAKKFTAKVKEYRKGGYVIPADATL